ncbi:MAG: hypothetical protein Kow00121_13640 [Elainellaceae cyanobacterium]
MLIKNAIRRFILRRDLKSWMRLTTVAVVGSVLGMLSSHGLQAVALTEQEVIDRLQTVPMFTLTDAEGAPLVLNSTDEQTNRSLASFFVSWQDAQLFLENLRTEYPGLAVQVVPVSLAEVYELAIRDRDQIEFAFVPMQSQIDVARLLLQQNGQGVEQFQGVPLFIAQSSNPDEGYLTIRQDQQEAIPIFFTWEAMQQMLDRLRQTNSDLANRMTVQVLSLENIISVLQSSDTPELNQIVLIPPGESIEIIRSLLPSQNADEAQETQDLLQNLEQAIELLKKPFGNGSKL